MLKIAGMIMIFTGCLFLGQKMGREQDLRLRELLILQQMVLYMKSEMMERRRPLSEVCQSLGSRIAPPFAEFLSNTGQAIRKRDGKRLSMIWKRNADAISGNLHLSMEDFAQFRELGNILENADVRTQCNFLEYYMEQLKNATEQERLAGRERKKLYQCLGMLSGALLVILIL